MPYKLDSEVKTIVFEEGCERESAEESRSTIFEESWYFDVAA